MPALFLTLILSFLVTFQTHSSEMNDTIPKPTDYSQKLDLPSREIPNQQYTPEQHFLDIKKLLDSIKYQNPQTPNEYRTNEIIGTFIPFLKQKLLKEKNVFILNTIPFLLAALQHPKTAIPKETQYLFVNNIAPLAQKRKLFLNRLTTIKE